MSETLNSTSEQLTTLNECASLVWSLSNLSPKTIQNYRNSYRKNVSPTLGAKSITEITTTDLLKALAPLTPQTYFQALMAMRVIFRECIVMGLVEKSPAQNIKPKKIRVTPKKFLTWEQVKDIDFGKYDTHIKLGTYHEIAGHHLASDSLLRPLIRHGQWLT